MSSTGNNSGLDPRPSGTSKLRRFGLALLIGVGTLLLLDIALSLWVIRDGSLRGIRLAPYDPPRFHRGQDQEWQRLSLRLEDPEQPAARTVFDRELGWVPQPNTSFELYSYDDRGARIGNPSSPTDPSPTRHIALYGCSMAHGDEVANAQAWPAALERQVTGLRVTNLGVSAYGLDQALLRMRLTATELAPDEVWFALLPAAALRATTCYRPLVRPWSNGLAFKPRFLVVGEDGLGLELVNSPAQSPADVVRLGGDAEQFLELMVDRDPWVAARKTAFAPRGSEWLHRSAFGRLWLTWRVRSAPAPETALRGPTAQAFAVQRAIAWNAKLEAQALGAKFRYLILPAYSDLELQASDGREAWDAFATELRELGIEVIDASATIRELGAEAFTRGTVGHYSPAGNAHLAEFLETLFSSSD